MMRIGTSDTGGGGGGVSLTENGRVGFVEVTFPAPSFARARTLYEATAGGVHR